MIRLPIRLFACALVILPGCADLQWSRPGADAATVSRDLDDCRAVALGRSAPAIASSRSTEAVTDQSRPGTVQPSAGSGERFVAEQEEVRRCMSRRGYVLRKG